MKKNEMTRKMIVHALFIALTVVFTLISNNFGFNGISINLSLITIALAAIIYGPLSGLLIGVVNGGIVMLSAAAFFAINPFGTVIVCLLKSGLAGVAAAYVYKALKNKNKHLGVVLASICVPIVNTTIFIIGSLLFFNSAIGSLITIFVSANFAVEFTMSLLLSPSVFYIVTIYNKKKVNQ